MRYAISSSGIIYPCTSVSRRSMPLWRKVKLVVIDAQQVQDRGVQVVAVGRVSGRLVRPFVAFAVGDPALDAAAGQPAGEGEGVVVAALSLPGCTACGRTRWSR